MGWGGVPRGTTVRLGATLLLTFASFALCTRGAEGQRLVVGDSVRVQLPSALKVQGRLSAIRGDTLKVEILGLAGLWPIRMQELETLEVYGAMTPQQGFRHGMILGATTGLFVGAAVGLALYAAGVTNDPDGPPAEQLIMSGLSGAGLGTVLGGLAGGFIGGANPGFTWLRVTLPDGS